MTTGIARSLPQERHCLRSICELYTVYFRRQGSNLGIAYFTKASDLRRCLRRPGTLTPSTRSICKSYRRYYHEYMVHAVVWMRSYVPLVSFVMISRSI